MSDKRAIVGIYDFELFPYALGDVLTWNVRTAMRCEELGRERVDIYLCVDKRHPAGIYQRGLVNPENFELFFSELYGAFGTHPKLGDIHIFRDREALLSRLEEIVVLDPVNAEAVEDYLTVLDLDVSKSAVAGVRRKFAEAILARPRVRRFLGRYLPAGVKRVARNAFLPGETALNNYFIKYIHSHESINEFAATRGRIPLLAPALGCVPDVDELIAQRFAGKKIVPFHLRLRRLDFGYGGDHSYARDSDFVEWYEFLRQVGAKYPEVEFVALGRLQEKPLELLRLPNVTSLRVFGLGLGHELTLMLKSHLFIGTSSGFAALANFSEIPYFVTRMNPGSCHAYAIPEGAECLPFARENQKLIYEQESSELLMRLLEQGLKLRNTQAPQQGDPIDTPRTREIDVRGWLRARGEPVNSAATSSRFYGDDKYRLEETAYLVFPKLDQAKQALLEDRRQEAEVILRRLEENFPEMCRFLSQHRLLQGLIRNPDMSATSMHACLDTLDTRMSDLVGTPNLANESEKIGWRPGNFVVEGGALTPLVEELQPALMFRATGASCYWHSERFVSKRSDGRITLRLDAKNSETPSRHQLWIFEDGSYRSVGELVVNDEWRTFEIPIVTRLGTSLEIQIDSADDWQWLSIRGVVVIDGEGLPLVRKSPVTISMAAWTGEPGAQCDEIDGGVHDCRRWSVAGKRSYVQTPVLPRPGDGGLLISFEARTDTPAAFTPLYLFEGGAYRTVAQYAFGPEWRKVSLLLDPRGTAPLKVQVDYPELVGSLSVRNCFVVPVSRGMMLNAG